MAGQQECRGAVCSVSVGCTPMSADKPTQCATAGEPQGCHSLAPWLPALQQHSEHASAQLHALPSAPPTAPIATLRLGCNIGLACQLSFRAASSSTCCCWHKVRRCSSHPRCRGASCSMATAAACHRMHPTLMLKQQSTAVLLHATSMTRNRAHRAAVVHAATQPPTCLSSSTPTARLVTFHTRPVLPW